MASDPATPDVVEYEREPVPPSAQKGHKAFWGMYAGEHTAGTEFMIGPLFIAWGVGAKDLLLGLLVGNLVAVLCWRFLTAEIGTGLRETLYYKLEKICGRQLVTIYNVANGILFCFLAGAMVTVSATAVGSISAASTSSMAVPSSQRKVWASLDDLKASTTWKLFSDLDDSPTRK